jgi:hypothetical protein
VAAGARSLQLLAGGDAGAEDSVDVFLLPDAFTHCPRRSVPTAMSHSSRPIHSHSGGAAAPTRDSGCWPDASCPRQGAGTACDGGGVGEQVAGGDAARP